MSDRRQALANLEKAIRNYKEALHTTRRCWTIRFEPRDLWMGVFWEWGMEVYVGRIFYVCLLPCIVIKTWREVTGNK